MNRNTPGDTPSGPASTGAPEGRPVGTSAEPSRQEDDAQRDNAGALGPSSVKGSTPAGGDVPPPQETRKKKKKKKKKTEGSALGSSRGIETMFRAAYRVHMDLTALADSKANIMISINGLILSIILASVAPKIDSNNWLLIPTTVVLLSCLLAIIFAVLSARPRINAQSITLDDVRRGDVNLLFFGNYSKLAEDDFVSGMTDLASTPELLYKNMMRDLYGIGTVLNRKFELLRRSYMVFMYGLTVSVLAFIVVFIIQALTPQV